MRRFLLIALLTGPILAQTFMQKLAAPVFYELSIQPNFQSNPLNLSEVEIEKAALDPDYLNGIEYSSSNVVSFSAQLTYAPRLFSGRKSRFTAQVYHHAYRDIPQRSYQTYSFGMRQSLGKYRYFAAGYWILPEYYLRNYRIEDQQTLIFSREACSFGTDRLWAGFQHRITKKSTIEYRLNLRNELYQAPFSKYDLSMVEGGVKVSIGEIRKLKLSSELQYGIADNDNDYDQKDRSYKYFNIRPTATLTLPGSHRLRLSVRYDQRAYHSEHYDDPLHSGRYQDELRYDLTLFPDREGPFSIEPYAGYRERRVDSIDPDVANLKSFSRYWFGIRFGFSSVIDMYF